jgi:hypothetical protein
MVFIGSGNFDSDYAYDTLHLLLKRIADEIREAFTLDSEKSLYEFSGDCIMANIDIFLTLCEHYEANPYPIVSLDEISKWKEDYLATFDRTIHLYGVEAESIKKRRAVIVETFDKLYAYVKEY